MIMCGWISAWRASEVADGVERVQVEDVVTGKTAAMPASGVFIYAGLTPNTELLGGLVPLDVRGQIVTDLRIPTPVPAVLAAAAGRAEPPRRLVTSAGD